MYRSDEFLRFLSTQLAYRAPILITFLVGLVISLVYWGRRSRQSMLVMLASVLGLVTNLGNCLVFAYLVTERSSMGSRSMNLSVLSVVTSILTVVPYILLFVAALSRRSEEPAFPVQMPPPPPFARRTL